MTILAITEIAASLAGIVWVLGPPGSLRRHGWLALGAIGAATLTL